MCHSIRVQTGTLCCVVIILSQTELFILFCVLLYGISVVSFKILNWWPRRENVYQRNCCSWSLDATISLKLPPLWPPDPKIWFAQVEAQFGTRGISAQNTKYVYIVASLFPEFAAEGRDLILKVPNTDPYVKLKEQLIKRTASSDQRRLQQLFNAERLGDWKPTQLLWRMQQLFGGKANTTDRSFLYQLFLQRLPSNVLMILASTADTTSIDELAILAD